jgi:putative transposase
MTGPTPSYHGYRFPPEIISHAVWLYHRFCLSFRDTEDLLAQRGIIVSYEAIRQWCRRFGPAYARSLRRRQGRLGDTWHLDELFVNIQGRQQYLWRAVDQDGDVIDILVQPRRDSTRGRTLLPQAVERARPCATAADHGQTAQLRGGPPRVMPSVAHSTTQYENNRAELSHQPTRQRERQMRRFKSTGHAQRFVSVHGLVRNVFGVGRHLLRAVHRRLLRSRAFLVREAQHRGSVTHDPRQLDSAQQSIGDARRLCTCHVKRTSVAKRRGRRPGRTRRGRPAGSRTR